MPAPLIEVEDKQPDEKIEIFGVSSYARVVDEGVRAAHEKLDAGFPKDLNNAFVELGCVSAGRLNGR